MIDKVMTDLQRQVDRLVSNTKALIVHLDDLESEVQFCVDYMDSHGLLDDHCFTFPDGKTVWATQTLMSEE